jgi:hypothetical protein
VSAVAEYLAAFPVPGDYYYVCEAHLNLGMRGHIHVDAGPAGSTPTPSPSVSATAMGSYTATPSGTRSPTRSPSFSPSQTALGSFTATPSYSPSATPTASPTPIGSATVSPTPGAAPKADDKSSYVYPSPARGDHCTVAYSLRGRGRVKLRLYNELGALISTREDGREGGDQSSTLDLGGLAPGAYYYLLSVRYDSGEDETRPLRKFVILR